MLFLLSVQHPSAIIPYLESLDLVKIFLCADHCSDSVAGMGKALEMPIPPFCGVTSVDLI